MHQCKQLSELVNSDYTCIVKDNDETVFVSKAKGVKPLLDFIAEGKSYTNLTVIDRIVGRGAIFLAIKAEAVKVITPIISKRALEVAKSYELDVEYQKVIPYIINRTGDGCCPIEMAVTPTQDYEEAYNIISLFVYTIDFVFIKKKFVFLSLQNKCAD